MKLSFLFVVALAAAYANGRAYGPRGPPNNMPPNRSPFRNPFGKYRFRSRPSPPENAQEFSETAEPTCDEDAAIAIVGGGCGGVYSAWRLASTGEDHGKIVIIEATNRIGGRLLSETMPNVGISMAELGGMRYVPTDHLLLAGVIDALGLGIDDFLMDEDNDMRPYQFRNTVVKQADLTTQGELPYFLHESEEGLTADEIEGNVFTQTVHPDDLDLPQTQMRTNYGPMLYEIGFRNAFDLSNASEDSMNYYDATSGYSDYIHNLNAAWLMYPHSTTPETASSHYKRVVAGMDTVPKELHTAFTNSYPNSETKLKTTVIAITELSDDRLALTLQSTDDPGTKTTLCADDVILSLTRRQLQRIQWNGFSVSPKAPLLDSVYSDIAYKLFLSFDSPPFWKDPDFVQEFNLDHGRTLSSLPSRNTFYYTGDETADEDSMIMMYGDGTHALFWADLATASADNPAVAGPKVFFPTTEAMVDQARHFLAINHGTTIFRIGTPKNAMFQLWSAEEPVRIQSDATDEDYEVYYPSEPWHVWKAGYNYDDIWTDIIHLDETQRVYIIGEAYSLWQGWIEGAFETAERMLQDHFDLPAFVSSRKKRNPRHRP